MSDKRTVKDMKKKQKKIDWRTKIKDLKRKIQMEKERDSQLKTIRERRRLGVASRTSWDRR